jgi:signal transduction histidine kinase
MATEYRASLWQRISAWILLVLTASLSLWGLLVHEWPRWKSAEFYPATDWVDWTTDEAGVTAQGTVPPISLYSARRKERPQAGEHLSRIDYHRILTLQEAYDITRTPLPGDVRLYSLQRTGENGRTELRQLFVRSNWRPVGLLTETPAYYALLLIFSALLVPVLLLLLVLGFPFVRTNWQEYLPTLALTSLVLVLFLLPFVRTGIVLLEDGNRLLWWERTLVTVRGLLLLLGVGLVWLRTSRHWWALLLLLLPAGFLVDAVWLRYHLAFSERWVELALNLPLLAVGMMSISGLVGVNKTVKDGLSVLLLFVALGLGVDCYLNQSPEAIRQPDAVWAMLALLHHLLWALPIVLVNQSVLRFGNLSLAAVRAFGYFLLFVVLVMVYLVVHYAVQRLTRDTLLSGFGEFVIMVFLVFAGRLVWLRLYQNLGRYFRSAAQRRTEAVELFIARIPRHVHTEDLVSDLESKLPTLYQTPQILCWLGEEPVALLNGFGEADLNTLAHELEQADEVWADEKALSPWEAKGNLERQLKDADVAVLVPLRISRESVGLLALGAKQRGEYTLDEVQQLKRLALQSSLTLEILTLLEKEKDLLKQTLEANLTALRAQINPHFLFNTLNSISELVHSNPKLAEDAIEKLAFIFRYTNKFSNEHFVTLENELSLVTSYLGIEKIRFGDTFFLTLDLDPNLKTWPMPAFVLQTVVENAVKHGVSKILPPKNIRLASRQEGEYLVLEVEDNGPGIDPRRITASTGLNNVLTRMRSHYGRTDLLDFVNTGHGTLVRIRVPAKGVE